MRTLPITTALAVLIGVVAACSDSAGPPCADDATFAAVTAENSAQDWRTEIDSIVATAPADSALNIIVFVARDARAEFSAWAEEHDIPVAYAFYSFSGYRITPRVGVLKALKESPGITGVYWGGVSLPPLCP